MVHQTTDATFASDIASGVVLVDFWAVWCGPCQVMLPRLEELAPRVEGKAKVMKMDVDQNAQTPSGFRIMSIPTIMVFKDGQIVEKLVGIQEVGVLEQLLLKHAG